MARYRSISFEARFISSKGLFSGLFCAAFSMIDSMPDSFCSKYLLYRSLSDFLSSSGVDAPFLRFPRVIGRFDSFREHKILAA